MVKIIQDFSINYGDTYVSQDICLVFLQGELLCFILHVNYWNTFNKDVYILNETFIEYIIIFLKGWKYQINETVPILIVYTFTFVKQRQNSCKPEQIFFFFWWSGNCELSHQILLFWLILLLETITTITDINLT